MKALAIATLTFTLEVHGASPPIYDTSYVEIKELKSWQNKYDIYLTKDHECGESASDRSRYELDSARENDFALLILAFAGNMKVNLRYSCGSTGYPRIAGVRVRKS